MALHEDRARAGSFGEDPEQYDRSRPSYPAALVDDLLGDGARRVLDVGCGTGKAGRLFAARGCEVLGVEPDARMAAVARRQGLEVEVGAFEGWEPAGRTFDLVVAGQAWHWIDPDRGAQKAADALVPGGAIGLFWNLGAPVGDAAAAVKATYARLEPQLARETVAFGHRGERDAAAEDALERSGRFEPVIARSWRWEQELAAIDWLERIETFSDHRVLPADRRTRLLQAVAADLDAVGGRLTIAFETWLVRARRR